VRRALPLRIPRLWDDLRVTTSANVTWHAGVVERAQRWESIGQRGATVWFTGLPASGKSTVAAAVEAELIRAGRPAYRLDGDNLRHGVCGDLGFTAEDRDRNVRRTAEVARLFADAGVIALVSVVSPYAVARAFARELHERDGLRFIEVFVNTPLEVCEERDPKGLYARAKAGDLPGFTGVDDPYEPPVAPDVELRCLDLEAAVERVLDALDGPAAAPSDA
jgi:adenylyl-sulfate kinase